MKLVVSDYENGLRIENFLSKKIKISKKLFFRLIRNKSIKVFNKPIGVGFRIQTGDIIDIYYNFELPKNLIRKVNYDFLLENKIFENEDLFIINKPIGIATQGGTNQSNSVDDAIKCYCHDNQLNRYMLMHRLDINTSGILCFSKNHAKKIMSEKIYLAVLEGVLEQKIEVNQPLLKTSFQVVCDDRGKEAKSLFFPLKIFDEKYTLALVKIYTGRTHQIRAHAKYLDLPVLGDVKYGGEESERIYIHSLFTAIDFQHRSYNFTASIDKYFSQYTNLKDLWKEINNIK